MEPLTEADVGVKVIGNPRPILMVFYSKNHQKSLEALEKFKIAEKDFPKVLFFACDVTDEKDPLRGHYSVSDVPACLLIVSGNSTGMFSNPEGFGNEEFNDILGFIRDMVGF